MTSKAAKRIRPGDSVTILHLVTRVSLEANGRLTIDFGTSAAPLDLGPEDAVEVTDGPVTP